MNTAETSSRVLLARRHFLQTCGYGVGKIALASLLTGAFPATFDYNGATK